MDITPPPGRAALSFVTARFRAAQPRAAPAPALSANATLAAARDLSKLYDAMWPGGGYVHGLLRADHEGHVESLAALVAAARGGALPRATAAAGADPPAAAAEAPAAADGGGGDDDLLGMLDAELQARGRDALRGDLRSGCGGALWFARTLAFLQRFLELLTAAEGGEEAYAVARRAYREVIARYHRLVVSVAVRVCLGAVGTRASLAGRFGFAAWEDAQVALRECADALGAVAGALLGHLRARGLDFDDTVGV